MATLKSAIACNSHEFICYIDQIRRHDSSFESLKDELASVDDKKFTKIWESLLEKVVNATIALAVEDWNVENEGEKVLDFSIDCAMVSISISEKIVPSHMYQAVLIMHGFLITVDRPALLEKLSLLCELWWTRRISECDSLVSTPITHILDECLKERPLLKFVNRLWKMREAFAVLNDTEDMIWERILNLLANQHFINCSQGRKFLAHIMATKASMLKRMYSVLKFQFPEFNNSLVASVADMVVHAYLNATTDEIKQVIGSSVIQDMMYSAVHVRRGGPRSLHNSLMMFLSRLHAKKNNQELKDFLVHLYQPILWRSLTAANHDVRANAAQIFFDAFPLIKPSESRQQMEDDLQMNFDLLFDLLMDEDHVVRTVSVAGAFKVLSGYWDEIPEAVSTDILRLLVTKHAQDQSNAGVRLATIRGLSTLIDNPNTYPVLGLLLPKLTNSIHDKNESVRLAVVKLLLKIKHIRAFKVWKIFSKDHVFARLEVDSPAVCVKLVELVYKSFINDDVENHVQVERCLQLIDSGRNRCRKLFRYISVHITVQQAVKYLLLLRKCIAACVGKHEKQKENRQPSLSTSLSNITSQDQTTPNTSQPSRLENFTLINNHMKEANLSGGDDEELSVHNTDLMQGLFDVICILWTGFRKELSTVLSKILANEEIRQLRTNELDIYVGSEGNAHLQSVLCDKFNKAMPGFLQCFQDGEIQLSLAHIAGFLSHPNTSSISKNACAKLRSMPDDQLTASECGRLVTLLIKCDRYDVITQQLDDWLDCLSLAVSESSNQGVENLTGKLNAVQLVLSCIIKHPAHAHSLREDNSEVMERIMSKCFVVLDVCQSMLSNDDHVSIRYETASSLLLLTSKLALIQGEADRVGRVCERLSSLITEFCCRHLGSRGGSSTERNEPKKPRRLLNFESAILSEEHNSENTACISTDDFAASVADIGLRTIASALVLQTVDSDCLTFLRAVFNCSSWLLRLPDLEVLLCKILHELSILSAIQCDLMVWGIFKSCCKEFVRCQLLQHLERSLSYQIKTCWAAVINSLHLHDVSLIADIMGNIINLIDDKQGQGHGVPDMQLKQSQFTKNTLEHLLNIVNGHSDLIDSFREKLEYLSRFHSNDADVEAVELSDG